MNKNVCYKVCRHYLEVFTNAHVFTMKYVCIKDMKLSDSTQAINANY